MHNGAFAYAPIGFPHAMRSWTCEGRILAGEENPLESPGEAETRAAAQERVWNLVWCRRLVYFLTLFASFNLALFPLLDEVSRATEFESPLPLVSKLVRFVGGFSRASLGGGSTPLPPSRRGSSSPCWSSPPDSDGVYLGARVSDAMRSIWKIVRTRRAEPAKGAPTAASANRSPVPAANHQCLPERLLVPEAGALPFLSAVLILYLGAALCSIASRSTSRTAGAWSARRLPRTEEISGPTTRRTGKGFDTGHVLAQRDLAGGARTLRADAAHDRPMAGWQAPDPIESSIEGFELSEVPSWPSAVSCSPRCRSVVTHGSCGSARLRGSAPRGPTSTRSTSTRPGPSEARTGREITFVVRPRRERRAVPLRERRRAWRTGRPEGFLREQRGYCNAHGEAVAVRSGFSATIPRAAPPRQSGRRGSAGRSLDGLVRA